MVGGAAPTRSQARHHPAPEKCRKSRASKPASSAACRSHSPRRDRRSWRAAWPGTVGFLRALFGALAVVGRATGSAEQYDPNGPSPRRGDVAYVSGERRATASWRRTISRTSSSPCWARSAFRRGPATSRSGDLPIVARLALKFSSARCPATSLSGGNQHKVRSTACSLSGRSSAARRPDQRHRPWCRAGSTRRWTAAAHRGCPFPLFDRRSGNATICDRVRCSKAGRWSGLAGEERTELALIGRPLRPAMPAQRRERRQSAALQPRCWAKAAPLAISLSLSAGGGGFLVWRRRTRFSNRPSDLAWRCRT